MTEKMEVPFFKFEFSELELKNVRSVLESGWLTTGSYAAEFEEAFAIATNCEFALAVNSCTAALHLALEAAGIGDGDFVIVPSLTCTATAEIVRYLGAHPLFVDVDEHTGLMNGEHVQEALQKKANIKACIVVHFAGQSAELSGESGLLKICEKYGIALIQDAAHAFPAADDYGPVGSIGDATCFSFYANKTITTGEGGMLVTNCQALADRARLMRLHGIDRDVWNRFIAKDASWEYDVVAPGYKYNMPDLNASIGIAQMEKADRYRDCRQTIALRYVEKFSDTDGISILKSRVKPEQHAWHLFPIILNSGSGISRNEMINRLNGDGIGTSVHYKPLHRMSYYAKEYQLRPEEFPNTERYWRGAISLPVFPSMTIRQVDYVADRVKHHLRCVG